MWKYKTPPTSDELYHHGVKGMEWGVRKYENEDGTLTEAGKKRYAKYRDEDYKSSTETSEEPEKDGRKQAEEDVDEEKAVEDIAKEVISGKWGDGVARKEALEKAGYDYAEVQKKVNELWSESFANSSIDSDTLQKKVDDLPKEPSKDIAKIVSEVISGKWGNGLERKESLAKAGIDYDTVQKKVNEIFGKTASGTNASKSIGTNSSNNADVNTKTTKESASKKLETVFADYSNTKKIKETVTALVSENDKKKLATLRAKVIESEDREDTDSADKYYDEYLSYLKKVSEDVCGDYGNKKYSDVSKTINQTLRAWINTLSSGEWAEKQI